MAYIDTKHIGQCETCRHYDEKLKKCKGGMFFCDSGESYSPNMFKIPTADVVEVVKCKDCKHCTLTEDGEYNPEDIVCGYFMTDGMNSTDFCSYGERKDEDE